MVDQSTEVPVVEVEITQVCDTCGKTIYQSEACSCKIKFEEQPKWMQDIITKSKEDGKASNGVIG
jgi:hypothetical protein